VQNARFPDPTLAPVASKRMNSRFQILDPYIPINHYGRPPRYSSRYRLRVSRAFREEVEELALHWQSRARRNG